MNPAETTLTERLQALAGELEGQMQAAEAANASPPQELESAKRMMTDLQEAAAILMMVDNLFDLLLKFGYHHLPLDVREQISAIQERMKFADPEP